MGIVELLFMGWAGCQSGLPMVGRMIGYVLGVPI